MSEKKYSINNMLLAFIAVVIVIGLVSLAGFFLLTPPDDIIMGQAEATQVRISGKVPGRIEAYRFGEGDRVHAGDTLVYLNTPEVDAKLRQAEAVRSAAEAQSAKAMAGARSQEVTGAYELWQKAKAGLEVAEKSFARVERLYKEGVLPAQKYDEASAQLRAMQATERAARSQYDMAINGAQREDKWAAQALVERASGAVSEVNAYLKEGALVAPIDGRISEIFPHRGELVGTGAPILSIADDRAVRVIFSIREDRLATLRIGSKLTATIPALGGKAITVQVSKIKDMGSYATWKATKPRDAHDLRTFEVTARPEKAIEGLLPGMTIVLDKGQI